MNPKIKTIIQSLSNSVQLWSFRELFITLVSKDLKVKYKGSVLGFTWSLLNPILMLTVYSLVFDFILKIKTGDFPFPVFFFTAFLPWNFFSFALSSSVNSLVDNSGLVTKVFFPREILPLSCVFSAFVQLLLTLPILILALLLFKIPLSLYWLGVIFVLILHLIFTSGIAMVLATINVFYRDIRHMLEILLQIWFWLTPIIYPPQFVPKFFQYFIYANPLTAFIVSYRDFLLKKQIPSAGFILQMLLFSGLSIIIGYYIFYRYNHRFAEEV